MLVALRDLFIDLIEPEKNTRRAQFHDNIRCVHFILRTKSMWSISILAIFISFIIKIEHLRDSIEAEEKEAEEEEENTKICHIVCL